jgi:hypothetical protein
VQHSTQSYTCLSTMLQGGIPANKQTNNSSPRHSCKQEFSSKDNDNINATNNASETTLSSIASGDSPPTKRAKEEQQQQKKNKRKNIL